MDTEPNMRAMIPTVMRMGIESSDMTFSCASRGGKAEKKYRYSYTRKSWKKGRISPKNFSGTNFSGTTIAGSVSGEPKPPLNEIVGERRTPAG
jgi:hypothetical protein